MALAHKRNMLNGFHQTDGVLSQPTGHHFDELRGNSLPVEHFDFDGLDSVADRAREALETPGGIEALIAELSEEFADSKAAAAIARVVTIISESRDPKLDCACLVLATGMACDGGISGAEIGRRFSVSKQAVSQTVIRLQGLLGLQPGRAQRTIAARQSMAASWKARHGIPAKSVHPK